MEDEPWLNFGDSEGAEYEFQVEFFTNERSLKQRLQLYFIKNQRSSLRIRLFNFVLKTLTCLLYVIRVVLEEGDPIKAECVTPSSSLNTSSPEPKSAEPGTIEWDCIWWVNRHLALYTIHVIIAFISLFQTILLTYLSYKGNIRQQLIRWTFILEIITTVPFIATLLWHSRLKNLFIPVFLNMWLAKSILEHIFNDVHRVINRAQSPLSHQLTVLMATIITIIFISACGIQHLQRGSAAHLTPFDSLWLVIVTFSTVGYGDISPDIWPSRLFMMLMICVSLTVLPMQLEKCMYTWVERKKKGGSYSRHRAQTEKHVVVCATHLLTDTVMDFLNEFYAHPKLQGYYVVLLSPSEMEESLKIILQIPIWAQRVIYIKGSALKDFDLQRCRMQEAEGCFILASRTHSDRTVADEHTILRSWAIRDHSPGVDQYVQLFRPEHKFHVKFAKHVVCEDEFKYALLAYNCLCPGTSALITLLLHTSRGDEGNCGKEDWQKLYGKCSGNEIYEIQLYKSIFFKDYCGKSFSYASFNAHRRYGVCLIGVNSNDENSKLLLNPGPHYNLQEGDTLFYLSITKEEHSSLSQKEANADEGIASMVAGVGSAALNIAKVNTEGVQAQLPTVSASASTGVEINNHFLSPNPDRVLPRRKPSIAPVAEKVGDEVHIELTPIDLSRPSHSQHTLHSLIMESPSPTDDVVDPLWHSHSSGSDIKVDVPPVAPYIGKGLHLCHLMRNPRPICCLQLTKVCQHCEHRHPREYNWRNRAIIIASANTSNGLYNFILPLRSQCLKQLDLRPIVLFLEHEPERHFKETIRHFPMVYWITGSIDRLDDWLKAGINYADNMVVVNKETSNSIEDDYLSDCNTIVAVQTLFKLFPGAKIITELSQSSNMRFMHFRADDDYALALSKLEKEVKRKGSHMSYMFRLPFSAGDVFSASMLDTLLYQAFVKDYLSTIVRLMCGIDQGKDSGFLTCIKIGEDEQWLNTYGRVYQKLCSNNGAIPIGIYRTRQPGTFSTSVSVDKLDNEDAVSRNSDREKEEISQLVKGCMLSLNMPPNDYNCSSDEKHSQVSYVIINPGYDLALEKGDIIYVLRPASKRHKDRYEQKFPANSYDRPTDRQTNSSQECLDEQVDVTEDTFLLTNQNAESVNNNDPNCNRRHAAKH